MPTLMTLALFSSRFGRNVALMPLGTGFPVTAVRKCGFLTQSFTRVATLHSGNAQRECQKAGACAQDAVPFADAALEGAKKMGARNLKKT